MKSDIITLAHGAGGEEMDELIKSFGFEEKGDWLGCDDDAASILPPPNKRIVFTSDSFTVDPIFFPDTNIGHLAFSGAVNDICVMGADPVGLSLSLILEEGLPIADLKKIIGSIKSLSEKYGVPVVTGDTKVMERGKLDKIIINVSVVGVVKQDSLLTKKVEVGDKVIISGGLGEHAVALLSKRFEYETSIVSDSKPLVEELRSIRDMIKVAKDPTRGGIAASLNELAKKHNIGIALKESDIPLKDEVKTVVNFLGINVYELACEGRVVCVASKDTASSVLEELKKFNFDAAIIGEVVEGGKVSIQTSLGKRLLPVPTGRIVPRIC